jgi:muconate cycloisomerase
VLSSDRGWKLFKNLLLIRATGFRQVKLKVDKANSFAAARLSRAVLGRRFDIRVDANMAWTVDEAAAAMRAMAEHGITSFEQPIAADDTAGLARLVRDTGLGVMVDESLNTRQSLERLLAAGACTAVNVRVSKCGGLLSAWRRVQDAQRAGLTIQVGCQVGESSLLSAAQLALLAAAGSAVKYGEGCFGRHLLREDPAQPLLQFGLGGRPPALPTAPGLGVAVDESMVRRYTVARQVVGAI